MATVTCCCAGQTPCGTSCCKQGVACLDRGRGVCGCPAGTTPCGSGTNLQCCAPGKACGSQSGCQRATVEQGIGPGYATQKCGCKFPCGGQQGCPSGMVCSNGCCKCAPGFVCGVNCCGLIGECCSSLTGCCTSF
jgi:hypothetical protein